MRLHRKTTLPHRSQWWSRSGPSLSLEANLNAFREAGIVSRRMRPCAAAGLCGPATGLALKTSATRTRPEQQRWIKGDEHHVRDIEVPAGRTDDHDNDPTIRLTSASL